jgi:hypothetical protein
VPPDHAPPDSDSGSPGNGAPTPLDEQAIDGRNASPQTRGQNDGSIIMGSAADEDGFTDTGAAGGTTDAWGRFPWQQSPGGR